MPRLMTSIRLLTLVAGCLLLTLPASAENWPSWRGPQNNGVSHETGIPLEWSKSKNVAWRLPLPGAAGATPVVWDNNIYLTTAEGDDLYAMCVTTDGKVAWKEKITTGNQWARATEGNSASPSPVTDGEHVWVFFGTGELACLTAEGEKVWQFNVQERYGKFDIQFGMTSTPVLDDGSLYMQLMHGDMGSGPYKVTKVIRLEAATGKEVWAVDRPGKAIRENKHSYASPIMYDDGNLKLLIAHGADCITAHNLEDGKEVWRCSGLNGPSRFETADYDPFLRFVSSPVANEGVIIAPSAKNGPTVAINVTDDLSGELEKSKEAVLWFNEKTVDVPSPLIKDGLAYFCRKDGNVFCVDLKTGEELYYERTHRSQHRASPVWVEGHIITTARDGHSTVIKAGRKFEIVAENDLGETLTASPAISDGTLYLRTYDALYAIRK